jgi:diguanylate cyclase (GGDEF)-like protein
MSLGRRLDTLSLMSIQHELAMNIGLNPQLMPLLRHFMKTCLRRLSIRRIYYFRSYDDEDIIPDESHEGPGKSFYFFMPSGNAKSWQQTPDLDEWLTSYFQGNNSHQQTQLFKDNGRYYHIYPLEHSGVLILERAVDPLPEELVYALVPVFDRLDKGCQAAIEHERIVVEMERRLVAEKRIEYLAYHDDLTSLPNRRHLLLEIDKANKKHIGENPISILLYIGLDNFRDINDSLGYFFGDKVLKEISSRLAVQHSQPRNIARVGGDEFGILYTNIAETSESGKQQAIDLARKALMEVESPNRINERYIAVAASIGIVIFDRHKGSSDTIMSMGSSALQKSKQLGRNTMHFYEESMTAEIEQRLNLDTEMRNALNEDQFELYLQPQVDAEGLCIGAETLIRWQHPEKGLISPAAFIPMAEESGFIVTLSDWVLLKACEMIKLLKKEKVLSDNQLIAVNLSAKHFHQADFVSRVISILERSGVAPTNLELEITESTLLGDVDTTITKMMSLREIGVRFSIDDFGTGYSSLAYLKQLPVDRIKIDRAFVENVDSSPDDAAIVEIILSMANHFNLNVIAEGVETSAEFELLKNRGCLAFQGYLFHRPMPLQQFIKTFR